MSGSRHVDAFLLEPPDSTPRGKMNASYQEVSYPLNAREISPPPRYSLHEPPRTSRPNDSLTSTEPQNTPSTDENTRHLTTSHIVLDGELTNYWSDELTASVVLSLLQREPLTPIPRPVSHNETKSPGTPLLTCAACFETFEDDNFPSTPIAARCDHDSMPGTHICLGCLRQSLDMQLSAGTSSLECPLCHVQLSDPDVWLWASRRTFQVYDRMRTWQALEVDAEFIPCIRPDCGYGQLHVGGLEDPIVVCGSCGSRTCFFHRETPWHEGITCTEYEEMINTRDVELDLKELPQ